MSDICTGCGRAAGHGRFCTGCGNPLDAGTAPGRMTDTAERAAVPADAPGPTIPPPPPWLPPPPAYQPPPPVRYPLFAAEPAATPPPRPRRSGSWLPVGVTLVALALVAMTGVLLLTTGA